MRWNQEKTGNWVLDRIEFSLDSAAVIIYERALPGDGLPNDWPGLLEVQANQKHLFLQLANWPWAESGGVV